jgi:pyruvate dehydrogenase E2 component (dihydrolipoamide acetyltransferase)
MHEVTMPRLSDSMEVGRIIQWKVREGDAVREGDILAEVESDKAIMELECFHDGVVHRVVHGDGDEVPVGEVIAFVRPEGEAPPAAREPRAAAAEEPAGPSPGPEPEATPAPAVPPPGLETPQPEAVPAPEHPITEKRPAASPYARRLAAERSIDWSRLQGTGPAGRVTARDVLAAEQPRDAGAPQVGRRLTVPVDADPLAVALAVRYRIDPSAVAGTGPGGAVTVEDIEAARHAHLAAERVPPPDDDLPALDLAPDEADLVQASFRLRTQAQRVVGSKHAIPHFYITRAVDVTHLLERKDELKQRMDVTVTHLVMLACVRALRKHPDLNRTYDHGRIVAWKGVHLGVAAETDEGLTVAVLRNAQELELPQIVERTNALVDRVRTGRLSADERRHPTFTVTNLGMFDVEQFEPIINPPSSITLAVASALETPVVRNGKVTVGRVMKLTAACDHRIVDGVAAARFLQDLRALIEDPDELLGAP